MRAVCEWVLMSDGNNPSPSLLSNRAPNSYVDSPHSLTSAAGKDKCSYSRPILFPIAIAEDFHEAFSNKENNHLSPRFPIQRKFTTKRYTADW